MAKRKLTRIEIDLAIDKILKKYDEYCYRFFKHPRLKAAFEERYFQSLKKGLDMGRFLAAEIDVVEQLTRKEEARLEEEPEPAAEAPIRRESVADRVLRENRLKIEKYPDVRIHKDANPEVRRLLGVLKELDERYMPLLQDALGNTNYSMNSQVMQSIESELRFMSSVGDDGVSPKLSRYLALFSRFPRDYKSIDAEEKKFILGAAFLLHDLQDILTQVRAGYTPLSKVEQDKLARTLVYLDGVIEDFRLKDLKRKSF